MVPCVIRSQCLRLGFDGQLVSDRNYDYGKRRSSVVRNERERSSELIAAEHRVLVIRGKDHHMRMPMPNTWSEILVRRPHVRKTDALPLRTILPP
jgi:hypothetical protein